MPPLVIEIVFVEELFFDAQAEVRKFDSTRIVTNCEPTEMGNAILSAMNNEAVKMVVGPAKGGL